MDRFLGELPLGLFLDWLEYNRRSPIGDIRGDVQAGIVASVLANIHKSKGTRPFQPGDFIPVFGGRRAQTSDEMTALGHMALKRLKVRANAS